MTDQRQIPWTHKDEWRKAGDGFQIVVTRHSDDSIDATHESPFSYEGPNRWAVYAYVYPQHPLFAEFDGTKMIQPATSKLHLHAYCSYLKYHYSDRENISSVQVGADYHHLNDDRYTFMETCTEASEVFNDAEILYNQLQTMNASKEM